MSFLLILFAATAVAVGGIQLLSHVGGSYVFGNARAFGIALEVYTLWTTLLTAGTVSGLLINTLAGLIAWGFLELGAAVCGGTRVYWSWSKVDLRNLDFGFGTRTIEPTLTLEGFAGIIWNGFIAVKNGAIRLFGMINAKSSYAESEDEFEFEDEFEAEFEAA